MDKKIEKKKWTLKRILLIGTVAVVAPLLVYTVIFAERKSKLRIEADKVIISSVTKEVFQEFIPQSGTVQPLHTIYLDAIEGGIIRKLAKEAGMMVEKGDVIVELTNSNLQLSVMNQAANLYNQINLLRSSRLAMEQNSLTLKVQLAEITQNINLQKAQYERYKALFESKSISQKEFDDVKEPYLYNVKRQQYTYESFKRDSVNSVVQMQQLKDSEERLQKSLEAVGQLLDNLVIRAPIAGQLSTPELQIGQSVTTGQRLGQVDQMNGFKIKVKIDELYLPRIDIGQEASFDFDGKSYRLVITKIYPTIQEGRFEVDMEFKTETPAGIKRGQSVRLRIELGSSAVATLIPVGGFYSTTGGNWIFVIDESGSKAYRRTIRIGRKNAEYYEVLEGLEPGEKVVTSSYENFGDNEVLVLN